MSTHTSLTCVLIVSSWDNQEASTTQDTPLATKSITIKPSADAGKEYSSFIHALGTSHNLVNGSEMTDSDVADYHQKASAVPGVQALFCHGSTRIAGMTHFHASIGNGTEVKQANLIIADLESMKAASVATLITNVADYVLVVDVGPEGGAGAGRVKNHDVLADVVMPAAVAARATLLGLVQEYGVSAKGGAITDVADMLRATAKQAGTPCHVEVATVARKGVAGVAQNVVSRLLPKLLFDALPSAGAVGPMESFASDRVVRFLEHRCDAPHTGVQPTGAAQRVQLGDGDSADELLATNDTDNRHPLMPVLKVHYRLRASLPLRCVLVSHFPQRQVALMYVVQGTMRRGESLMAANLHYMGVTSEEAKAVVPNWDTLVDDCRVQTLSQYPMPCPVEVAYPGEFVTVQLKKGADHVASAATPTADDGAAAKSKKAKPAPSGCFLETLPTWSLCGKLPGAGATGVDALFPRPFAVAQWSLSEVYRHTTPALPPHCFDASTGGVVASIANGSVLVVDGLITTSHFPAVMSEHHFATLSIGRAAHANEVAIDTHIHFLVPDNERRAVMMVQKSKGREQATVVSVSVLLRKLSLFMAAAAGAMGASPTPTAFVDMVESVPVSEDVRHLLRVAAGNELAYELPLRLLGDLCVFSVDSIPSGSPVRVAIEEGSSDFSSINHHPTSADLMDMKLIKGEPSTHKAAGTSVGPWLLLASAYHHHCEAGESTASVGVGRSLIAAARWAAMLKDAPRTSALYMCGRHSAAANIVPCSHIRAAKGPAYLPFLSAHTRRLFNARVGKLLPFETVWRCVLPLLVREWGAGRVHEPKVWLGMLFDSAVDSLPSISAKDKITEALLHSIYHTLLVKDGCSLEVFTLCISQMWLLSQNGHLKPKAKLRSANLTIPCELVTNGIAGAGKTRDFRLSPSALQHLTTCFAVVGGIRTISTTLIVPTACEGGLTHLEPIVATPKLHLATLYYPPRIPPSLNSHISSGMAQPRTAALTLYISQATTEWMSIMRMFHYLKHLPQSSRLQVDVLACIASYLI